MAHQSQLHKSVKTPPSKKQTYPVLLVELDDIAKENSYSSDNIQSHSEWFYSIKGTKIAILASEIQNV